MTNDTKAEVIKCQRCDKILYVNGVIMSREATCHPLVHELGNEKEWWEDMIANWPCKQPTPNEIRDIINCTRSRFKEEVVKALEGMKRCPEGKGKWFERCIACGEAGEDNPDCVNQVIREVIEAIKKL